MNTDNLLMEILENNCNNPVATKKQLIKMLNLLDNIVNDNEEYSLETRHAYNDVSLTDNEIIIYYACDEWKSYDSLRFIGACTLDQEDYFYHQIQDSYNYTDDEMETYIYSEHVTINEMEE